jgi:hypothetical protein
MDEWISLSFLDADDGSIQLERVVVSYMVRRNVTFKASWDRPGPCHGDQPINHELFQLQIALVDIWFKYQPSYHL